MMKNSDGNVKVSFCDMELHSGYDDIEMEQPIGSITIQSNETEQDAKLGQMEQDFVSRIETESKNIMVKP